MFDSSILVRSRNERIDQSVSARYHASKQDQLGFPLLVPSSASADRCALQQERCHDAAPAPARPMHPVSDRTPRRLFSFANDFSSVSNSTPFVHAVSTETIPRDQRLPVCCNMVCSYTRGVSYAYLLFDFLNWLSVRHPPPTEIDSLASTCKPRIRPPTILIFAYNLQRQQQQQQQPPPWPSLVVVVLSVPLALADFRRHPLAR